MSTQNLISLLNVTLAADAEVTLPHGLVSAGNPVAPFEITCDRPSTIGVLGADDTSVTFKNHGADAAVAVFRVVREHSVSTDPKDLVAWQGWDGTASPVGPASGDLGGIYPGPIVVKLNTYPLDLTAPVAGDYLRFDGTVWRHTLVTPGDPVAIHGCFSDSTDQDIVPNTAQIVLFNTTETANGVAVVDGSKLQVAEAGVYAVNISPQLVHTGGTTRLIKFWLRVDGVDVPRSTSSLEMGNNNNRTIPFFETVLPLNAGQYIQWVFTANGNNTSLEHFDAELSPPAAFAVPAIPSVIASVKRIGS